jgi:membrane-associated protease RseP (regulator of RpoE activity)
MSQETHHSQELHHGEAGERSDQTHIVLPAPTFWPIVFAFGICLLFAGLVTHWSVAAVGLIVGARGVFGWWRDVIPHEQHEEVPIDPLLRPAPIEVEERSVVRLAAGERGHRVRIPETVHPYSSGVLGGLAGGAAMAILACLYGLIAQHSIWYPVNLLAGAVIPQIGLATVAQLKEFNMLAFVAASVGHLGLSILVGILYAVMLPMFPKYAPFWAGILMPLFWSALVAVSLSILNPALNSRISWPWFVACQLGYGLVGGFVIARSTSISTMQSWTLAERAFIEAPGLVDDDQGRKE